MESLFATYRNKLDRTDNNFVRYLMKEIYWTDRLFAITGSRGTGKTTLMLQYIKQNLNPGKAFYMSLDDLYFTVDESGSLEHIMQMFFWLDEILPSTFNSVQLEKIPRKKGSRLNPEHKESNAVTYHDSDDWPANAPMAMWLNNPTLNQFMREWTKRKQELKAGEITRAEYFEWKLNWPRTCDDCGKVESSHTAAIINEDDIIR